MKRPRDCRIWPEALHDSMNCWQRASHSYVDAEMGGMEKERERARERERQSVKVRLMHGWLDGRLDR